MRQCLIRLPPGQCTMLVTNLETSVHQVQVTMVHTSYKKVTTFGHKKVGSKKFLKFYF